MSAENEVLARRFLMDIFQERNLAAADEIVDPDFTWHFPGLPEPVRGPQGVKQIATMYHTAFPDLRVTYEDSFSAGDKVVSRWSSRGTQTGPLGPVPPTNKPMRTTGINIYRLTGGKIVEGWIDWDQFGMMQQLGLVPSPG